MSLVQPLHLTLVCLEILSIGSVLMEVLDQLESLLFDDGQVLNLPLDVVTDFVGDGYDES